jgi:hypothetical protein
LTAGHEAHLFFRPDLRLEEVKVATDPRERAWAPKFRGGLATPIVATAIDLDRFLKALPTGSHDNAQDLRDIFEQKLRLLYTHYGLDRAIENRPISELFADPSVQLVLRLACDYVPGFRFVPSDEALPRNRGRPREYNIGDVLFQVDAIQRERKRGIVDAIRTLRKRQPDPYGKYSTETLEARYHESRARWRSIGVTPITLSREEFEEFRKTI